MPDALGDALSNYISFSIDKLRRQKVLIKNIAALQYMGFLDNIIADKTGCLTKCQLQISKVYFMEQVFD